LSFCSLFFFFFFLFFCFSPLPARGGEEINSRPPLPTIIFLFFVFLPPPSLFPFSPTEDESSNEQQTLEAVSRCSCVFGLCLLLFLRKRKKKKIPPPPSLLLSILPTRRSGVLGISFLVPSPLPCFFEGMLLFFFFFPPRLQRTKDYY